MYVKMIRVWTLKYDLIIMFYFFLLDDCWWFRFIFVFFSASLLISLSREPKNRISV